MLPMICSRPGRGSRRRALLGAANGAGSGAGKGQLASKPLEIYATLQVCCCGARPCPAESKRFPWPNGAFS